MSLRFNQAPPLDLWMWQFAIFGDAPLLRLYSEPDLYCEFAASKIRTGRGMSGLNTGTLRQLWGLVWKGYTGQVWCTIVGGLLEGE